jgi:histone deacetylase 1/2
MLPVAATDIPMNEYYEYFGPTYRLDVPQSNTDDLNTPEYLEKIKVQVFENLRHTAGGGAPSVQMNRTPLRFLHFPLRSIRGETRKRD